MTTLLTTKDIQDRLGISECQVYRLIRAGTLPRPIKLGNANRWRPEDIEAALDAARQAA